jgi:hypothetical protein
MSVDVVHRTERPNPVEKLASDLKLGGTYEVIHGKIFISKDNYAIVGDIVDLDDVDAALVCSQVDPKGKYLLVRKVSKAEVERRNDEKAERDRAASVASQKAQKAKKAA